MENLNIISETALITLRSRVIESNMEYPVINDKKAAYCLSNLKKELPSGYVNRLLKKKLPVSLTRHLALRARKYDFYTEEFLAENHYGLVVSLGCGFDTRYWRVLDKKWNYIELDLPEVIEYKKKILGDNIDYKMIGASVLEDSWMNIIAEIQKNNVLFLAEGLFMYLPKNKVVHIFNKLSQLFINSQIVFEVVNEKYTKGFMKKMVSLKMKKRLGTQEDLSYNYGIKDAKEIETYGEKIKLIEEWSYFEDDDIKPEYLKLFKKSKAFTRTQWTLKASIGTN